MRYWETVVVEAACLLTRLKDLIVVNISAVDALQTTDRFGELGPSFSCLMPLSEAALGSSVVSEMGWAGGPFGVVCLFSANAGSLTMIELMSVSGLGVLVVEVCVCVAVEFCLEERFRVLLDPWLNGISNSLTYRWLEFQRFTSIHLPESSTPRINLSIQAPFHAYICKHQTLGQS
jgi:hypothetical protein